MKAITIILRTYEVNEMNEKTYKGTKYIMWDNTPQEAEQKIKDFLDKVFPYTDCIEKEYYKHVDVITEASDCVLIDLWLFDDLVTDRNTRYGTDYIITRQKCRKNNKYGYRIRFIL